MLFTLFRLITHNYRSTRQQISGHKILRMSAEQSVEKTHLDVNNSRTNDAMPPQTDIPAEFKLFDLKVSVVVPEGSPYSHEPALLPCNARVGDYFELQGELLFLPPGQGMSIYSIGMSSKCNYASRSVHCMNHSQRLAVISGETTIQRGE